MIESIKYFSDAIIRLFVAYLIICFMIVAMSANYSLYRSESMAYKQFKKEYVHFVVSQPNKLKKTVKKTWNKIFG